MRYRGLEIDYDIDDASNAITHIRVYDGADALRNYCLFEVRNVDVEGDISERIKDVVDTFMNDISNSRKNLAPRRGREQLKKAIAYISETMNGESLYRVLTEQVGMTDDEIRSIGHTELIPFFDRDCYARLIAGFLIDYGTAYSTSGNYNISFEEIEERFGMNLSHDENMRKKVMSAFDKNVVAGVEATEDGFDMMFDTSYCPNYYEETSQSWGC